MKRHPCISLSILPAVMIAASLLLVASCGKKKEPTPPGAELPKAIPFVQLYPEHGALLVIFPKDSSVSSANFHATAVLTGAGVSTSEVQRYPLGDIQALLVTAIHPERFRIISQAFVKAGSPWAGGRIDSVRIVAGQITVLIASPVNGDHFPFPKTPLHFVKQVPWTYNQSQRLEDYVSGITKEITRG